MAGRGVQQLVGDRTRIQDSEVEDRDIFNV